MNNKISKALYRDKPFFTTASQVYERTSPRVSSRPSIRDVLKKQLEDSLSISVDELSDLQIYYIRGVSEFELDGQQVRTVIYEPEFLYTANINRENFVGFRMRYSLPDVDPRVVVLGDPDFPRFNDLELVSIPSLSDGDLLYPYTPGSIIVRFADDLSLLDATQRLEGYLEGVKELVPSLNLFIGNGGYFMERSLRSEIEGKVDKVKYAQLNHINRIIDFSPGWMIDQVL